MARKTHIRVPHGIPTAVAHNRGLIKLAGAFLMLKHLDQKGSGCIKDFEKGSTKDLIAEQMSISKRTLYVRIDELQNLGLVSQSNGHLFLASYTEFEQHFGITETGNYYVKPKPNVRLEYQIRALIYKENQRRQLWMIREKLKAYYNRMNMSAEELRRALSTEMDAIVWAFKNGIEYFAPCRPDLGISQRTMAKRLTCLSHTSAHYWEQRLKQLKCINLVTNRTIESKERARSCDLVQSQNINWSRPMQLTFLQLPNLVICT